VASVESLNSTLPINQKFEKQSAKCGLRPRGYCGTLKVKWRCGMEGGGGSRSY
jgi:hypothetical protein